MEVNLSPEPWKDNKRTILFPKATAFDKLSTMANRTKRSIVERRHEALSKEAASIGCEEEHQKVLPRGFDVVW